LKKAKKMILRCKEVLFAAIICGMTAAMPHAVMAQAIATAYAVNGGTSISESTSFGDAYSETHSAADGGTAVARQTSEGMCGGFARGISIANTVGGSSQSNGFAHGDGPFSTACDRVTSSSFYGKSIANGTSIAGPYGDSNAVSTALSQLGPARSDAYSQAVYGSGYSDSLAHSRGPLTVTRTHSNGYGGYPGSANATSIGVGIGVTYPVFPLAEANAYANDGSTANARAVDIADGN
jgi:hypothetical protein